MGRGETRGARPKVRAFFLPGGEMGSGLQEPERREKSAGHRRGKKGGAGVKALPLEQNSSPLGNGSPCKGHAVTAADRESTPGLWQKTGRSKPDAFYARPPALGAGV